MRDFDGLKSVLPKGAQIARANTERGIGVAQEVFANSVKTGEAIGALARASSRRPPPGQGRGGEGRQGRRQGCQIRRARGGGSLPPSAPGERQPGPARVGLYCVMPRLIRRRGAAGAERQVERGRAGIVAAIAENSGPSGVPKPRNTLPPTIRPPRPKSSAWFQTLPASTLAPRRSAPRNLLGIAQPPVGRRTQQAELVADEGFLVEAGQVEEATQEVLRLEERLVAGVVARRVPSSKW